MSDSRKLSLLQFCLCVLSLIAVFLSDYFVGYTACILCQMQRIVVAALGVFAFLHVIYAWRYGWLEKIYLIIINILVVFGVGLSVRHLWLILHPVNTNVACLPGISYLFDYLSIKQIFGVIVNSNLGCGEVKDVALAIAWPFLLLCFYLYVLGVSIYQWWLSWHR